MSKNIVIIGAGAIGLSCALHCARKGHRVTVIERHGAERDGCSFGNAGMIVPSHFVPLAAPGMVKLGLKWMLNPSSPFYLKPRLNGELFDWCVKFWRASNAEQVRRAARTAIALLHLRRGAHGRHADGQLAALRRHDGNFRFERGH